MLEFIPAATALRTVRGVKAVAEVFRSGFSGLLVCFRGMFRLRSVAACLVLGSTLLAPKGIANAQSTPPAQTRKAPPAGSNPANSNPSPAEPATPPPAVVLLPPVQAPEHAPVIAWDGQQLTIDADNSSLADVMLAIRSHTGASIEMPGIASQERIAVHLGPAPIREVLSSLLYGTDFNYVIQSSKDDENKLAKVILTSRDGGDNGDIIAAENGPDPASGANPRMRMMRGYAAPGKRDYQVSMSRELQKSSSDNAETAADSDSSSPAADQTPAVAASDSVATNPQPTTSADAADSAAPADTMPVTAGEPMNSRVAGNVGSDASNAGATSSLTNMESTLQKMYQQRQLLQAQQNHPVQAPTPTP